MWRRLIWAGDKDKDCSCEMVRGREGVFSSQKEVESGTNGERVEECGTEKEGEK